MAVTYATYYLCTSNSFMGTSHGVKGKLLAFDSVIKDTGGMSFDKKTSSYSSSATYGGKTYDCNYQRYTSSTYATSLFLKRSKGCKWQCRTSDLTYSTALEALSNSRLLASATSNLTNDFIDISSILSVTYGGSAITDGWYYMTTTFNFNNLTTTTYNKIVNGKYFYFFLLTDVDEYITTKYTLTENLTGLSGINNPTEFNPDENFTLNYKANTGYEISLLSSNIGTVTISDDKTTATITGTATNNIVVNGTANLITYSVTNNLTNITGSDSNPFILTQNEYFELSYTVIEGFTIDEFTCNIGTVTISDDKTSATVTGTATENIIVTGTASDKRIYYTVTENLSNITSDSDNKKKILENSGFSLGYTAVDGFEISSLTTNIGSVYISSNKTFALVSGTATENIIITGVATEPKENYTVTENLTNITSVDTNPKEFTEGEKFTLQYTSYNGYKFKSLTSNIGSVSISDDKLSATITGVATENITVTGVAYLVTYVHITGTISNATCNYTNGEEVDTTKQFQIIANTGYEFLSSYKYKIGDGSTNYLAKTNDNTTLYKTLNLDEGDYTFNDDYTPTKQVQRISGFCNLYSVTNDELLQLSKKRIQSQSDGSLIDYGQFITNLYILPFAIPPNYLGDSAYIILGNYDSQIASTLISNYVIPLNYGSRKVGGKYSNVYDYLNTNATLYLPYLPPVSLEVEKVIDYYVRLHMFLDIYSGTLSYVVYSECDNYTLPIASGSGNISTQIPFIQKQNNTIVNQLSNINTFTITTPYVEISRNKPYYDNNISNTWGKGVVKGGIISDIITQKYGGYLKFNEVQFFTTSTKITNTEYDEIITLLTTGIFV